MRLTKKDFDIETFRAGGPGGQNQNKRETGVRVKHPPSGAVGESRETRSQGENKRRAFRRMAESEKFVAWVNIQMGVVTPTRERVEEKVRTYSFPRNTVIDHRTGKKVSGVQKVLDGDIDAFI